MGTQRTTFSWPTAIVAIVPSGQDDWLPAAGDRPPLQRIATVRVPPQTRPPRCVLQADMLVKRLLGPRSTAL